MAIKEEIKSGAKDSLDRVAAVAISQRKKTDVRKPQVIDEALLYAGCEELPDCVDPQPHEILSQVQNFPNIPCLRLSFNNIIEISNLGNFISLQILHLDNNIIDRIDNLGHLVNLTWLDLSFNHITEMDGLSELINLTDLSLYHNSIEEIKGLDNCKKLNILSLGKNKIINLKEVDKLRPFQFLKCVCFDGNPMCNLDSYNQHVLAYLPTLQYLDYMLIDRKTLQLAQESYQLDELTELKEAEAAQQVIKKQQAEQDTTYQKLKLAFLDCTHNLLGDLFPIPEPDTLLILQCYAPLKEDYKEKLNELIKTLTTSLEDKNDKRLAKVKAFEKAVKIAEEESEGDGLAMIKSFNQLKKKVLAASLAAVRNEEEEDEEAHSAALALIAEVGTTSDLLEELKNLDFKLIQNELQLQECLDDAIDEFEAQMADAIKFMTDRGADFFRQFEDLEKMFHTGLLEGAMSEFESFQTNQDGVAAMAGGSEHDQKKAQVMGNREEIQSTILNQNEMHTVLIQNKDDYMQNAMNNWMKTFFDKHRERQYKRNRQRIDEIKGLVRKNQDEIINHDKEVQDEDGNEDDGHMGYA